MRPTLTALPAAALLLAAALSSITPAQAQLVDLVNNINLDNIGVQGGWGGSDYWMAQGFSTPSNAAYILSRVDLALNSEAPINGTYAVSLWSATGINGTPGTMLLPISSGNEVSLVSSSPEVRSFNAPSSFELSSGMNYYVVVTADTTSDLSGVHWLDRLDANPAPAATPGTVGGWTLSENLGSTWSSSDATPNLVETTHPFQLAVVVTPVPEPGAYAVIAGLCLVSFAAVRQARRRFA
jgi:hypothetical protein